MRTTSRGLAWRIGATSAGLVMIYVGLLVAMLLAGVWGLVLGAAAVVMAVFQVRASDKLAMKAFRAHEVPLEQAPGLHAAVERLALAAGIPKPRVAVSDSGMPNALAVGGLGRTPIVCVDRKLVDLLEPAELEGVLAHELAHVLHRDVTVMTIASFFSIVAALMARIGAQVGHAAFRIVALGGGLVAWGASAVLLRALSRYRELAADRTAATLTGRPAALASALMKVDSAIAGIPSKDLRKAQPVAALAFSPLPGKRRFRSLTATHPTLAQRVAALEQLERTMQG